MVGPTIIRGILEILRVGLPIMLPVGLFNAWAKGRLIQGWEFRGLIAAVGLFALSYGCKVLLARWPWLSTSTKKKIEADHA